MNIYWFGVLSSPAFAIYTYYSILIKAWLFKDLDTKKKKDKKNNKSDSDILKSSGPIDNDEN